MTDTGERPARAGPCWWGRRRSAALDIGLAVASALECGYQAANFGARTGLPALPAVVLGGLVGGTLVLRRRWPVVVVLVAMAITPAEMGAMLAVVGLYSLATSRVPRRITTLLAVLLAASAYITMHVQLSHEVGADADYSPPFWFIPLVSFLMAVGSTAPPMFFGLYVGARRRLVESLRERADGMEHELTLLADRAEERAEWARNEERTRIAREMHDVVAHRVSLMVVHAAALEAAVGKDSEKAVRNAELIGEMGRQALTELRTMLGVLRTGESAEDSAAEQPRQHEQRAQQERQDGREYAGAPGSPEDEPGAEGCRSGQDEPDEPDELEEPEGEAAPEGPEGRVGAPPSSPSSSSPPSVSPSSPPASGSSESLSGTSQDAARQGSASGDQSPRAAQPASLDGSETGRTETDRTETDRADPDGAEADGREPVAGPTGGAGPVRREAPERGGSTSGGGAIGGRAGRRAPWEDTSPDGGTRGRAAEAPGGSGRRRSAEAWSDAAGGAVGGGVGAADGSPDAGRDAGIRPSRRHLSEGAAGTRSQTGDARAAGEAGVAAGGSVGPDLGELETLVGQSRAAGMAVELAVWGDERSYAWRVEQTAFRVVQEALTNVHKHAPGARVWVRLAHRVDEVALQVENAAPSTGEAVAHAGLPSGGNGLVGMRERVSALGGTFVSGPTEAGGFRVSALIPCRPVPGPG